MTKTKITFFNSGGSKIYSTIVRSDIYTILERVEEAKKENKPCVFLPSYVSLLASYFMSTVSIPLHMFTHHTIEYNEY